jgi:phosphate transport system substrate-binding protein
VNRILLVLVAGLVLVSGCRRAEPQTAQEPAAPPPPGFTGAGASFPAPLYTRWAADYHKATGVRINYQSIGSGAGIRQVEARTVDFGASDAPLKDEALQQKGLVQFPMVIGGVVPVVNIKGIAPGQLRLTGQVLGDIYLGKVKRWNDPAITALNPGVPLPDAMIAPIRRADGSGTTFLFTSFLSQANADWKARVGEGTAVNWPTGAGGKGNEGVAAFVGRLPNTIGYVEYAYVKQIGMKYVLLQNAAGHFVAPDDAGFQAAAAGAAWNRSFHQVLTNRPGAAAWPITGATFILLPAAEARPGQADAVLRFFDWAYANGDATAASLGYVPLPEALKALVRKSWQDKGRDAGTPAAPR